MDRGRDTVVMPGITDSQAGGLGAAALGTAQIGVGIGTTCVCTGHVDFKRTDVKFPSMGPEAQ